MKTEMAWVCENYPDYDEITIVFADTLSEAKTLGSSVLDVPYINVRVKRARWADGLPQRKMLIGNELVEVSEIDFNDPIAAEVLRERGWMDNDREHKLCEKCDLYEWEALELSHLKDGICGYCRELLLEKPEV